MTSTTLATNIGTAEATAINAALGVAGQTVLTLSVAQASTAVGAVAAVRVAIQSKHVGVVIIGGHDVVPLQILDTLSAALSASVSRAMDDDQFVVWSDDGYGNPQNQAFPTLPVTRIPDAGSAQLVWTSLGAPAPAPTVGYGIRNINRPFADGVYGGGVPSPALPMLTTITTLAGSRYAFGGERLYVMMHGSDADATQFFGEDNAGGYPPGVSLTEPPSLPGNVMFTGCCWGAMIVKQKACDAGAGAAASRGVSESIALTALSRGALAFIGCTGTHDSPTVPPYAYFGGPLHTAFWNHLAAGSGPAKALFDAKYTDYEPAIPHGLTGLSNTALEQKIMYEYTSLGLGW